LAARRIPPELDQLLAKVCRYQSSSSAPACQPGAVAVFGVQGSALVFQVNCWRQVSRCQPLDVTYNPLYLDGHIFGSEEVIGTSDQTSIPNQGIPYIKLSIDDVLRNFKNAKDFPGCS
jgi:hypothetical protein